MLTELLNWLSLSLDVRFAVLVLSSAVALFMLLQVLSFQPFPEKRVNALMRKLLEQPIAHRSGFPENTLAGIQRAKAMGMKVVEVDLQYTKDGCPVLLHDYTVDRTSNGTGHIRDMTFEEARNLDFGSKFGTEFAGEKIPTLHEALELCLELDLVLLLDVKSNRRRTSALLKELFTKRNLYDRVVVVSFFPELLYMVRITDPNIVIGLSKRRWKFSRTEYGERIHDSWWNHVPAILLDIFLMFATSLLLWRLLGLPMILLCRQDWNKSVSDYWKDRNVHLVLWTFKDIEEAQPYLRDLNLPVLVDDVTPLA